MICSGIAGGLCVAPVAAQSVVSAVSASSPGRTLAEDQVVSVADVERMLQRKQGEMLHGISGRVRLLSSPDFQEQLALSAEQRDRLREVIDDLTPKRSELESLVRPGLDVSRVTSAQARQMLKGFVEAQRRRIDAAEDFFQVILSETQYRQLLGTQAKLLGPTSLFDKRIRHHCDVDDASIQACRAKLLARRAEAKRTAQETKLDVRATIRLFEVLEDIDEQLLRCLEPAESARWNRLTDSGIQLQPFAASATN